MRSFFVIFEGSVDPPARPLVSIFLSLSLLDGFNPDLSPREEGGEHSPLVIIAGRDYPPARRGGNILL